MKHKISTGVFLFEGDKVLLIKHVNPETGFTWWVPPGGGIENSETLFDAGIREVKEEAGINIEIDKVVYLRHLIYRKLNKQVLTVYMVGNKISGDLSTKNLEKIDTLDRKYIKEARFFSKEEAQEIEVFPEIVKDKLWEDRKKGFPNIRFLGSELDKESN